MVAMTWSSESLWSPVSCMAMRAGVDGFDRSHAVALDAGDLDEAADGVAGHAEVVLHGDLGGVLDLGVGAVECGDQTSGGHRAGDADLALAADLGSGDAGVLFVEDADGGGGEEVADDAFLLFCSVLRRSACSSGRWRG